MSLRIVNGKNWKSFEMHGRKNLDCREDTAVRRKDTEGGGGEKSPLICSLEVGWMAVIEKTSQCGISKPSFILRMQPLLGICL